MARFTDKVVLVTGGTRGIGQACAEAFAREGAQVALCGRNAESAQAAAEAIPGETRGYACDMARAEDVKALVAQVSEDFGAIGVLVNNAGITRDGLVLRMKDRDWRDVIAANLDGAFYAARAAARGMLKQRYGRIINVSSIVGVHGQAGQANYCAAKAGLIGLTKALARELASRNITANAVAPGFIETDMTATLGEDAKKLVVKNIPAGRTGSPADVAEAVLFLASDAAAYITGEVLSVDGGLGM